MKQTVKPTHTAAVVIASSDSNNTLLKRLRRLIAPSPLILIKRTCSIVECMLCTAKALNLDPTAWLLPIHAATLNRGIVKCLHDAIADEWASTGRRRLGIGLQWVMKRLDDGKIAPSSIIGEIGGFCVRVDAVQTFHETTPPELLADSTAHVSLENHIAHLHTPPTGVRLVGDFEDEGAIVRSDKTLFASGELVVADEDHELAKAVIDQLLEHEGSNIGAVGDVNVERLSHVVRLLRHNVDVLFALYWVDDGEMLMNNEFDLVFTDTSVGLDRTFSHSIHIFNHLHPMFLPLVASALVLRRLGVRGKHDPPTETFLTAMTMRVPAMHLMLKRVPRGLRA